MNQERLCRYPFPIALASFVIVFAFRSSLLHGAATQPTDLDQCLSYVPQEDIVFDEGDGGPTVEPDCWKQLRSGSFELQVATHPLPQPELPPAPHLPTPPSAWPRTDNCTVLLLHRLTSPGGHVRLVYLAAVHQTQGMVMQPLVADCTSGTPVVTTGAVPLRITNHADTPLRLHSARLLASDQSKFIIDFDYEGKPQTITGQLQDDDTLPLKPSCGWLDADSNNWHPEDAARHIQVQQPLKVMHLGYPARIDGAGSWLSKDGKLLVIRSMNTKDHDHDHLDLWDTATEKKLNAWDVGGNFAWPKFSDDGKSIVGFDNGERIFYRFRIPSGEQQWRVDLSEVFTRPNSAHSFYMDGVRAAISSPDEGLVRVFDMKAQGQLLKRIHVPVEGEQNLTVSEDGKVMAFWRFAPRTPVLFFNPDTGKIISRQPVNPSVEEFGFTADDHDFIEITDDGLVFVDVATGKIHMRRGDSETWRGAKISDSSNVIVSSENMTAFNLPQANIARTFSNDGQAIFTNSLAVSGDGTRAVTLLGDGSWAFWDLTAEK